MAGLFSNMKKKFTLSGITVIAIIFIMTFVTSNINWGKDHWKQIIISDGKGYYAYLPAIFIYRDLNFGFFEKIENKEYYDEHLYYDYRASANGRVIDKYFCGTALAELPFFLAAHALSSPAGYKTDGYSNLYHIAISIAALFYLFASLVFLNKILTRHQIGEWKKSLVLVASVFGTNLFYYTVKEPAMSHIYSFAFIAMFIHYSGEYFSTLQRKYLLTLAMLLGIICLIRPVNGLIILIWPFTAGDSGSLRKGLLKAFRDPVAWISGLMVFPGLLAIQAVIYKISAGSFFIDAYTGEGFDFLHPHLADILFSYKKGLFLYTPIYLVSLTGGIFLWKASKFRFFSWFGFMAFITYVFSSWWCWYYGGSFSSRVYVEYIPLFMILLAMAINGIRQKKIKLAFAGIVFLLIIICQIQTYQYRYFQIHWSEMTKEKYWDVFLRIDRLIR